MQEVVGSSPIGVGKGLSDKPSLRIGAKTRLDRLPHAEAAGEIAAIDDHRIRTPRAEAAPDPQEPAEDEQTHGEEPEERGVEEGVDCEAER